MVVSTHILAQFDGMTHKDEITTNVLTKKLYCDSLSQRLITVVQHDDFMDKRI